MSCLNVMSDRRPPPREATATAEARRRRPASTAAAEAAAQARATTRRVHRRCSTGSDIERIAAPAAAGRPLCCLGSSARRPLRCLGPAAARPLCRARPLAATRPLSGTRSLTAARTLSRARSLAAGPQHLLAAAAAEIHPVLSAATIAAELLLHVRIVVSHPWRWAGLCCQLLPPSGLTRGRLMLMLLLPQLTPPPQKFPPDAQRPSA